MKKFDCDVLIIGAGVAGLAAADLLTRAGLSVQIIEARSRMGGRLFTAWPSEEVYPIELGAEFIHGKPADMWEMANDSGVRVGETCGLSWDVQGSEIHKSNELYARMDEVMTLLIKTARNGSDLTFAQFAQLAKQGYPALSDAIDETGAFIEDLTAADVNLVSIQFLARGESAAREVGQEPFRIIDGYENFVQRNLVTEALRKKIRLSTTVRSVTWQPNLVAVESSTSDYHITLTSRKLIITVPVSILQLRPPSEGAITFSPPLVEKQKIADLFKMGSALKVVVTFQRRFWEEIEDWDGDLLKLGYINRDDVPIKHWWSHYPVFSPVLTGWVGGPQSEQIAAAPGALEHNVIISLAKIFNESEEMIESLIKQVYFHDWNNDPLSRGVYSYELVQKYGNHKELAAPIDDTLFFAGEATDTNGASGTVHGALRSGRRAAGEILAGNR
jgi:monoamine oxidase